MRFTLAFLIFAAFSACDSSETPTASPPADAPSDPLHLRRGLQAEPGTLDPHKSIMTDEWAVLRDLYMGLTYPGPDGAPGPGAAESWTVSDDGLRYTFSLRPNLMWSDGSPLNAAHFVAGLRRLFDPGTASPSAPLLDVIENAQAVNRGTEPLPALGVRAPSPTTVVITLARPTPNLPEMLAMPFAAPYWRLAETETEAESADISSGAESADISSGAESAPVYNGPFILGERVPDTLIRLMRNLAFTGPAQPTLETVSYIPTADDETALRLYQAGQLDLHPWFPSDRRDWLDENYPGQAQSGPARGVSYLVFNTDTAPFESPPIRRALALAVDSALIADRVLEGSVDTATRFVPRAVTNYSGPAADQRNQTDRVALAKELLNTAGYGPDRTLTFDLRVRQSGDDRKVATALQAFWRSIGVEANIITTDLKTHFDDLEIGRFAAADAGWALFNAPESFLFLLSSTDAAQLNYGRYSSAAFDAAYTNALAAPDAGARADLFAKAEQIALKDAAVAPLYHYRVRALVRPSVKGFTLNPGAINPSVYLRKSAD